MCRIAYLGPACRARPWLIDSPRALLAQARAPSVAAATRYSADGFGIGWIDADGREFRYRSEQAIWRDPNLEMLASAILAPVWLGSVQTAKPDCRAGVADLQPFTSAMSRDPAADPDTAASGTVGRPSGDEPCGPSMLFTHDGWIDCFDRALRQELRGRLTAQEEDRRIGSSDSAWLHAWWRVLWAETVSSSGEAQRTIAQVEDTLARLLWEVDVLLEDRCAVLNITLGCSDGIVAARHAIHHDPPVVYFCTDDERFPEGAQLVASEPITDPQTWHVVPAHHLLLMRPEQPPELHPL